MITTHISGGLGNQLFQYAAGRALAIKLDTKLKLDSWVYAFSKSNRTFELANYQINAVYSQSPYYDFALHQIKKFLPMTRHSVFGEKNIKFDLNFFNQPQNTYLLGHWQSERYFKRIASIIRQDITYKGKLLPNYQKYLSMIENSNSVFCHIRRGDYVSNSTYNQVHGTCSINYYIKALSIITNQIKRMHVFIFSDDIEWVRKNLTIKYPNTFIDEKDNNACQELELMRNCKHAIIANSSFSWWGAWLNENKNKIIIAPKKWFNQINYDASDIVPSRWMKI